MDNYGILSLAPALIAVILAFITREALFSILCGVLVGLLITGQDLLFGFTGLIQSALGNADYIWVIGIEVFIGIMVAFFQKSGAIEAVVDEVIAANPDEVARYRDGNTKVIGFFVGQCMKAMRGQGNPKIINELLAKKLG